MDAFSEEQMATSCYIGSAKTTKPPLPADKIALLEGEFIKT